MATASYSWSNDLVAGHGRAASWNAVLMSEGRHQVIVVGGGFGGIRAARALARADVGVTIVDRTNHHLFQPLLYQVATGILPDGLIAPALRSVVRKQANARVVLADVRHLDLQGRLVQALAPDGQQLTLPYDTLVVAAGCTDAYFGHDEWSVFAPGLKTLEDARHLRSHILGRPGGVPDLRGHRGRADRSRGGRPGRRARARGAAAGVQVGDHNRG
jgi:choline dehydrogenase-like flavoprotein